MKFERAESPAETVTIVIDGETFVAAKGESVASALLCAGVSSFRPSVKTGSPRAPYCMIGNCFECLVEIDGVPHQQACLRYVHDGMEISTSSGISK